MSSVQVNLSEFKDQFLLEKEQISRYRKSKRLAFPFQAISSLAALFLAFFIFAIAVGSFTYTLERTSIYTQLYDFSSEYSLGSIMQAALFSGILYLIFILFRKPASIFKKHAEKAVSGSDELALHHLAAAIKEYEEGNYDDMIGKLEKFSDIGHSNVSFDDEFNTFSDYVDNIKNKDGEERESYIQETFEDAVLILVEEISKDITERQERLHIIVDEGPSKYSQAKEYAQSSEGEVNYRDIIHSIYAEINSSFAISFWGGYALAAAVGIGVFMYIDKTLGIAVVTILLTGIQIYNRRNHLSENR